MNSKIVSLDPKGEMMSSFDAVQAAMENPLILTVETHDGHEHFSVHFGEVPDDNVYIPHELAFLGIDLAKWIGPQPRLLSIQFVRNAVPERRVSLTAYYIGTHTLTIDVDVPSLGLVKVYSGLTIIPWGITRLALSPDGGQVDMGGGWMVGSDPAAICRDLRDEVKLMAGPANSYPVYKRLTRFLDDFLEFLH